MSASTPHEIPARRRFDAIVIGSGSGGLTVAIGLSRFGREVLLVERERMGGDCTNTGCIPSKALLHESAAAGTGASEAASAAAILASVRSRRDALRDHELSEYGGAEGVTFVYGTARLDPDGGSGTDGSSCTVSITGEDGTAWTAEADDVVLATGSSPRLVPVPGLDPVGSDGPLLTNENLFELTEAPDHLAILGGGAVGLEMAVAFRRLGSEVSVVETADQVLPGLLPQAAALVAEALEELGVSLHTGCQAVEYIPVDRRLRLAPSESADRAADGGPVILEAVDRILMSVGRVPNTGDLELGGAGVEVNDRGAVVIDSRGRTTAERVWAVGDMTDRGGATHHASIWGRRIIQSIVYPHLPIGSEPLRPAVVFTAPEVAAIGVQPVDPPPDVLRITVDGSTIDRAYTDRVSHGLLVVDVRPPTGEVLGATVVGPGAGEIIATFSLAMKTGIGFHRWYGTVIPYPTFSEVITEAVEQYLSATASDLTGHIGRWAGGLWGRGAWRRGVRTLGLWPRSGARPS